MEPAAPVAPAGCYAATTETLRSATKWLLTVSAGVGAVLVAGLQLGGLGQLVPDDIPRLVLALAGLFLGFAGVGYMIWRASGVLTDDWILLAQLSLEAFEEQINAKTRRQRRRGRVIHQIYAELTDYREELFAGVASTPEDLYAKLTAANQASRATPADPDIDIAAVHQATRDVVEFANYRRTRIRFDRLRRDLAWAALPVVVGAVMFALAQPAAEQKSPAQPGAPVPTTSAPGPDAPTP
ncbi:MAG TPA: hypothetical protein VIW24_00385 [Aldersonia sp.]